MVADVYRQAHRFGLKGITIYRYGSRNGQALHLGAGEEPYEKEHSSKCDPSQCKLSVALFYRQPGGSLGKGWLFMLAPQHRRTGARHRAPELEGVPTESVVRFGPTVSTILAVADASKADLIVMCSHGHTDIKRRLIMGSVAEKLARAASVPVLVLGEDGPVPGEAHPGSTRPLRASPTGWLGSCRGSAGACGLSAHRPGRLCPRRAPPDARRPASAH